MLSLQMHDSSSFLGSLWYDAVSGSSNLVVQGFLAEQICFSSIAIKGLPAIHSRLDQMLTASFDAPPSFSPPIIQHTCTFQLPTISRLWTVLYCYWTAPKSKPPCSLSNLQYPIITSNQIMNSIQNCG